MEKKLAGMVKKSKIFQKKAMLSFFAKATLLVFLIYPLIGKYSLLSEKKNTADPEKEKLIQISQTMGHLLGKTVAELPVNFEMHEVVKGLQDSTTGKRAPLSEEEWEQELRTIHEGSTEKELVEVDHFFEENGQECDIEELVPGKLQYKILHEGEGEEVQAYYRPHVRYSGFLKDGQEFLPTQDVALQLDEAMPGLQKGIVGMKKGERRTLYIHPELSFQNDPPLQRQEALVFEVEVIDVDMKDNGKSPLEELISTETTDSKEETTQTK